MRKPKKNKSQNFHDDILSKEDLELVLNTQEKVIAECRLLVSRLDQLRDCLNRSIPDFKYKFYREDLIQNIERQILESISKQREAKTAIMH